MDTKDLELLTILNSHGRWSHKQMGDHLDISPKNVARRVKLMKREGIIQGFSAFIDRRMLGYETTYLRSHMGNRGREDIIKRIISMPQVASVYPNMDDFALIEIIHWDDPSLQSAIRAVERITAPLTVSATYTPHYPDMVPDPPSDEGMEILSHLVEKGRIGSGELGEIIGMDRSQVDETVFRMTDSGVMKVKPMISEGMVQPCPCFTILVWMGECSDHNSVVSRILKLAEGMWDYVLFDHPPGIWIKFFGEDLFAMDHSLERLRREDSVRDLTVVMPEGVVYDRSPDLNLIKRYMKHGPEGEMGL